MENNNASRRGPKRFRQMKRKVSPIIIPMIEDKPIARRIEFSK